MTDYSKDIYDLLLQVPEGLPIRKIARHVYNAHTSLFETIDFEDVKHDVTAFLTRSALTKSSPIVRTGVRGFYKLNPHSNETIQLRLNFLDENADETEAADDEGTAANVPDNSIPDMFAGMY